MQHSGTTFIDEHCMVRLSDINSLVQHNWLVDSILKEEYFLYIMDFVYTQFWTASLLTESNSPHNAIRYALHNVLNSTYNAQI